LQLVSQYAVYLAPRIVIGHRFRLLDFQKQSHSGYFDPNNILPIALSARFITRIEFFIRNWKATSVMTFRRNGVATNNLIHGGSGSLGVKPTTNLAIEVNAEGGNFAAGSVSGFSYLIIGPRLSYRF